MVYITYSYVSQELELNVPNYRMKSNVAIPKKFGGVRKELKFIHLREYLNQFNNQLNNYLATNNIDLIQ